MHGEHYPLCNISLRYLAARRFLCFAEFFFVSYARAIEGGDAMVGWLISYHVVLGCERA